MLAALLLSANLSVAVSPSVSAVDAPVSIAVRGARPHARVTITARSTIFGQAFESSAVFVANASGEVRADSQPAIDGTYRGTNGMGLFWSMIPDASATHPAQGGRHFDYLAPHVFSFVADSGGSQAKCAAVRQVLKPGIRFRNVTLKGVIARYYRHDGKGALPAIIVLGGAEGGLPEDRPAILASHGFNVLALAYFGAPGLPSSLSNIPVEDVGTAIAWLAHQPSVDIDRLAIVGGSKGAELGLLAASHYSQVRAVVAFSPSSVVYPGLFYGNAADPPSSWSFEGVPVPYVNGEASKPVEDRISLDIRQRRPVSYAPEYLAQMQNATNLDAATIPVERVNGPLLLVSGDDDRLWPSSYMAAQIMDRRENSPHRSGDVWLRYAHAGHEIGEPYYFFADSTLAHLPRYAMALGGTPQANQAASADAWPKVIAFLHRLQR